MVGTIHDDSIARSLGFESAFVPGETVGHFAFREIFRQLGPAWFTGGWYSLRFEAPVYVTTVVHMQSQVLPEQQLSYEIVDARNRRCVSGKAGILLNTEFLPWGTEVAGSNNPHEVFPDLALGRSLTNAEVRVNVIDLKEPFLGASNDENPYFLSKSPWGQPLVPPQYLILKSLHSVRAELMEGVASSVAEPESGMWAEHAIVQYAPVFQDQAYQMVSTIADKGRRVRADFVTVETEVIDSAGERAALIRHGSKWLRNNSSEPLQA